MKTPKELLRSLYDEDVYFKPESYGEELAIEAMKLFAEQEVKNISSKQVVSGQLPSEAIEFGKWIERKCFSVGNGLWASSDKLFKSGNNKITFTTEELYEQFCGERGNLR